MTATATRPQDRLRDALAEANAIAAKGIMSKDESAKVEELLFEVDGLKSQIDSLGKLGRLNEWAGESAGMPRLASGASMLGTKDAGISLITGIREGRRVGIELLDQYGEGIYSSEQIARMGTDDYRGAFKSYMRGKASYQELKTLQEGADTAGGFAVPADILDRVISREPTPTRVAGNVTQLQTSRDQLLIPKITYNTDNLYTTGMRVTWTGEVPASATTHRVTDPVFGQVSVPVFTAMMSLPITNDMIEDAAFPIVSYAAGKFGETIDLLRDNMCLNGNGIGQPAGILINPGATDQPVVVNSGAAAALTADGLIKLGFSLPEQYDDNARWVFNKTNTGQAIALLQDSNKRYIWGSGLQDSGLNVAWKDRQLLGYPIALSGFMPNVAAGTYPIVFGDLRGYYLVNRIGFSVQVLRELYAETNQVLLLGRIRFGGLCAEPWKLFVQQVAA